MSGSNFLLGLLLVRFVGLSQYGVFVVIWSLVTFFSSLQQAAVFSPLMTNGAALRDSGQWSFHSTYFYLQCLFGLVCASLLFILIVCGEAAGWRELPQGLAFPSAICIFFFELQDFFRRVYLTNGLYRHLICADLVSYGGQIAGAFALTLVGALSISNLLYVMAFAYLIGCSFGSSWMFRRVTLDALIAHAGENWAMSKWLVPSALLQWVNSNVLIFFSSFVLGTWAAGAYRATLNMVGILNVLYATLENTVPVKAAVVFRMNGLLALVRHTGKITVAGAGITVLSLSPILLFAPVVLRLFYGEQLVAYSALLRLQCVIYVLTFISIPARAFMRSIGESRVIFQAYVASTITTVAMGYFVIVYMHVIGIAVALGVSQIVMLVVFGRKIFTELRRRGPALQSSFG
ncbi:lipopolysaccharide biosynthesis protein [Rhizomicrobium electricum]|nr:hypothetical protein [Rhizomicrobium electricum]NIJ47879.1 O-antigen/teichoic acid export membrane protein [Rhizomicrobium electricum]